MAFFGTFSTFSEQIVFRACWAGSWDRSRGEKSKKAFTFSAFSKQICISAFSCLNFSVFWLSQCVTRGQYCTNMRVSKKWPAGGWPCHPLQLTYYSHFRPVMVNFDSQQQVMLSNHPSYSKWSVIMLPLIRSVITLHKTKYGKNTHQWLRRVQVRVTEDCQSYSYSDACEA